jgi:hypothetical protein
MTQKPGRQSNIRKKPCHKPTFRYLSDYDPDKSAAAPANPLFQKGSAGISAPKPLWNVESLENLSQIAPKGHRTSESYAIENTSRDRDRASVSKGVGYGTEQTTLKTSSDITL